MSGTGSGSHSHSFSKRNLKIKNQKDLDRLLASDRLLNRKLDEINRRQSDPAEINRVRELFGDGYATSYNRKPKTKWADHYKHKPIDHDLESTIDQIRNSTGKYKHTKIKRKKLDQDKDTYMTVKDLENSGKLSKGSGMPIGLIMGLVFVGVMLMIALPIFDTITTEMQMENLNSTTSSNLSGFPSLVQDNLLIFVVLIPMALFVLFIARLL